MLMRQTMNRLEMRLRGMVEPYDHKWSSRV